MAPSSTTSRGIDSPPANIFISYSSADRDHVEPLVEQLERAGWRVWWDRKLLPGTSVQQEIEQALNLAGCVIVIWSKNSVASDWVIGEADEGRKRQVLIPVSLDGVAPPLQFRTRHTVDLSRWRGGDAPEMVEILRALGVLLGSPPALPARPSTELTPVPPSTAPAERAEVAPAGHLEQMLRWSTLIQLLAHGVAAISVFIDQDQDYLIIPGLITGPVLAVAGLSTTVFAAQARRVAWWILALCIGALGAVLGTVNFFLATHGEVALMRVTLTLGAVASWGVLLPELLKKQGGAA